MAGCIKRTPSFAVKVTKEDDHTVNVDTHTRFSLVPVIWIVQLCIWVYTWCSNKLVLLHSQLKTWRIFRALTYILKSLWDYVARPVLQWMDDCIGGWRQSRPCKWVCDLLEAIERELPENQLRNKLGQKDHKINELQEQLATLEQNRTSLEEQLKCSRDQNRQTESECATKNKRNQQLTAELNKTKQQVLHKTSEVEQVENDARKLREKISQIEARSQGQGQRVASLESELKKKEHVIEQLEKDVAEMKSSIALLQEQLKDQEKATENPTKKALTIYLGRGEGDYSGADEDLIQTLQGALGDQSIDLEVKDWQQGQTVSKDTLAMMLCINTSRLGTDVGAAFGKINFSGEQPVILVVMHHKPKHQTKVSRSQGLLDRSILERNLVGLVVDAVFWNGDQLHNCNTNQKAVKEIVRFVVSWLAGQHT